MRQSALALEGPPEKRFRGRDIPLGAEQEIDSLSFFVDRAVKISPAPLDLHVGFIDSPGGTRSAREAVPAPFEVRNIALDPAHYRRMGQRNPAFDHHFHEIAKAELEPEIPPDAEDDDFSVEMAAFEKILNVQHSGSRPPKECSRQVCRPFAVCTRTSGGGLHGSRTGLPCTSSPRPCGIGKVVSRLPTLAKNSDKSLTL